MTGSKLDASKIQTELILKPSSQPMLMLLLLVFCNIF